MPAPNPHRLNRPGRSHLRANREQVARRLQVVKGFTPEQAERVVDNVITGRSTPAPVSETPPRERIVNAKPTGVPQHQGLPQGFSINDLRSGTGSELLPPPEPEWKHRSNFRNNNAT